MVLECFAKPLLDSYNVRDLLKLFRVAGKSPPAETTSTTEMMGVAEPTPAIVDGVYSKWTDLIL
jgi:hypothetical protein